MQLTRIIVLIVTCCASTCHAGIPIKKAESTALRHVEAAVKILRLCYGDRVTPVGLAGDASGVISKELNESSPVMLIDATARIVANNTVDAEKPLLSHKLQLFVVSASSSKALARTLTEIKASRWWNHLAAFLILDWPPSNDGCSKAFEMLWTAWKMNVLRATFMCYHQTEGRLYTYNPYTSQAPDTWLFDKSFSGKNNHPWSLFVREYEEGARVCSGLDFDKTLDLGGYEIHVSIVTRSLSLSLKETRYVPFGGLDQIYCASIFPALNAAPKILVHRSRNDKGFITANGSVTGILREVVTGLTEIGTSPRYQTSLGNLTHVYPLIQSDLLVLTQYRGYKSQLSKIISVVDTTSRYGLGLVLLITMFIFKFFFRQPILVAYLNTLRIICDSSLPKIPTAVSSRIYLGCLFFFMLTMQGIYRGQLASRLTKREPLRNVNSVDDLAQSDHMIYGPSSYRLFFQEPAFQGRFVEIDNLTCAQDVVKNPKVACVTDEFWGRRDAARLNLHISQEKLSAVYDVLPIRPDWPLEERVNTILMRSVESYRVQYLYHNLTAATNRRITIHENAHKDRKPKVMTLKQLNFAFVILGIGLGFATISFIIEVAFLGQMGRKLKPLNPTEPECAQN